MGACRKRSLKKSFYANGALVERYEYDVYGAPTIFDSTDTQLTASAIENPYLFTGRRYDPESGNYYYRARVYSPSLGRFLQMDPLGYVDEMNLYAYVMSNPVLYHDPFGLTGCTDFIDHIMQLAKDVVNKKPYTGGGRPGEFWGPGEEFMTSVACTYVPPDIREASRLPVNQSDCQNWPLQNPTDLTGFCPQLFQGGQDDSLYRHLGASIAVEFSKLDIMSPEGADCTEVVDSCGCRQKPSTIRIEDIDDPSEYYRQLPSGKTVKHCLEKQAEVIDDILGKKASRILHKYLREMITEKEAKNQLEESLCSSDCDVDADVCCDKGMRDTWYRLLFQCR